MPTSRISKVRKIMRKESIEHLLVTDLVNIEYLTGLKASVAMMYVGKKQAVLFLDQRYSEMASKRAKKDFIIVNPSGFSDTFKRAKTVWLESSTITVEQKSAVQAVLKNKKLMQHEGLIQGLRRIKDQSEIRVMNKAIAVTRSALRKIPSFLREGMTEKELAWQIEKYCRERGAEAMAFETIVGFGSNTSLPHHRPTMRRYKRGDLVQIDMGAKVSSYCSDFSRIYIEGEMNHEMMKCYRALQKAKKAAEKLLRSGVKTHALDATARDSLATSGYPGEAFCHALGHGVGMEIHEGVVISQKRPNATLKKGDVITIEPGLYFPGKFGMRLEDTHII